MKRAVALAGLSCIGCSGDGSDIGPNIPRLPVASYLVTVRADDETDADPRGVTSAVVSIAGIDVTAPTDRAGRADLRVQPTGTRNLTIDARNASARAGDALAGYTVALDMPGRNEAPFVLYLPDLAPSAGTALVAGPQTGTVLDDSATSGAIVTISAGIALDLAGAATATLRTGVLAADHLPGALPAPASGVRLTTRGVFVAPAELRATPGASVSLPNDLALPANTGAELFRLDPLTGAWTKAADAVVDGAGTRIGSVGGVTAGGLYCFASTVATTTSLSGRALDATNQPIDGVLVRTAQAWSRSDSGGRWTLPQVAAVDGAGQPRTVRVELHGGRDLFPVRASLSLPLQASAQEAGDTTLDTDRVSLIRALLISRGRAEPLERIRVSATEGLTAGQGFADTDAFAVFPDITADGRISYLLTHLDPRDEYRVLSAEAVLFVQSNQRDYDSRWFFDEQEWITDLNGDSLTWVVDERGNGIVDGAAVLRDTGDGVDRFHDITRDGRLFRLDYGDDGQATTSITTRADRRTVTSAFSTRRSRVSRVELPVQRAVRRPLGAFVPFGLFTGTLAPIGDTRRVRATRLLSREDWFDEVFEGEDLAGGAPVPVDPAVTTGVDFTAGVPAPAGSFAAVAGTTSGGVFTLEHLWFASGFAVASGTRTALGIGAGHAADTAFTVAGALTGLDASIAASDLTFDLALELPNEGFVDAVRGVGGNHTPSGADVILRLPALAGPLAGARHLVALGGSGTSGGTTVTQKALAVVSAPSGTAVAMLPAPVITAPAAGAMVPATGFDVEFTLPPGTVYAVVNLRQETADASGDIVRDWTAVVPPDDTRFRFRTLPAPATTPLAPGSFTLTVTAARIDTGRITRLDLPYERVVARYVGLSAAEREVAATASASIAVTLQ